MTQAGSSWGGRQGESLLKETSPFLVSRYPEVDQIWGLHRRQDPMRRKEAGVGRYAPKQREYSKMAEGLQGWDGGHPGIGQSQVPF